MLVMTGWPHEWAEAVTTEWPFTEEFFEDNREYWPDSYLMYVAM